MCSTRFSTTHWVAVSLNQEISFLNNQLKMFGTLDIWIIHLDDILEYAVFQLNARERPIVIDPLLALCGPDVQGDETLSNYLTLAVELVYDVLSPVIPGNMEVQEYTLMGKDIMIGGVLF